MDSPDIAILYHWFDESVQLLQRLSIVVVAAVIATRFNWLRQALRGGALKRRYLLISILIFGLLAIIGTHSEIVIDVSMDERILDSTQEFANPLKDTQAIVSFRDTMTLAAGLIGGPWVGLGTGLIAGTDRYYLGGLAGFASGFGTIVLGIFAGTLRYFKPHWVGNAKGVFIVALTGTFIQRLMILVFVKPYNQAIDLSWEAFMPIAIANTFGCVLLFWIIRDLYLEKLESEAKQARLLAVQSELRALRAQVAPHFLNNTLNDLTSLIIFDPNKATKYVRLFARFFKYAPNVTESNTISLAEEAMQVHRFLALQRLELNEKLHYVFAIPKELRRLQVVPGCLLTLVKNAFKHGFKNCPAPYHLSIAAQVDGSNLSLIVTDNGGGVKPDFLPLLGKSQVKSNNNGRGVALFQLVQSMRLIFGDPIELVFQSTDSSGTVVILKQPIKE